MSTSSRPLRAWAAVCGLNAVGTHIWGLLAEPTTPAQIAADLPVHFEVEPEEAERATQTFLADLLTRGLIEPAGA